MPTNVFGNSSSSYDNGNKIVTSLFVKKLYLRTNYIEANKEKVTVLENQYRIKNLLDPLSLREAALKSYVDDKLFDPNLTKNTTHVDFKYKISKIYTLSK